MNQNPTSFYPVQVQFNYPEWIEKVQGNHKFSKKGEDFIVSILKQTGTEKPFVISDYPSLIIYPGKTTGSGFMQEVLEPEMRIFLHTKHKNNGHDVYLLVNTSTMLNEKEIAFIIAFSKNLGRALPLKSGKINVLSKPTIPPGTRFEMLPAEIQNIIEEQAIDYYKSYNNPLKKLANANGGKRTRKQRSKRRKTKRRA